MTGHDFLAKEIAGLNLPPNYEIESRIYGPAVVDRTTDRLVFVAARSGSREWLEDAAWEDYADYVHDNIVERRVAMEFVSAEASPASARGERENEFADRAAKIAGDAIDLFLEFRDRHGDEALDPVIRHGREGA